MTFQVTPYKTQSNYDFKKNYAKGEKAEHIILGVLLQMYIREQHLQVQHVSQYSPGIYRDKDGILKLPDFAVLKNSKIIKYFEVKSKKGYYEGEYINLTAKDALRYVEYADRNDADIELIFHCIPNGNIYSLKKERLRLKPDLYKYTSNNTQIALYETAKCEILFSDLPKIFWEDH